MNLSKVWSIGIQKHIKMIQHHFHISSTYQFKQVGVHEKQRVVQQDNKARRCVCARVYLPYMYMDVRV